MSNIDKLLQGLPNSPQSGQQAGSNLDQLVQGTFKYTPEKMRQVVQPTVQKKESGYKVKLEGVQARPEDKLVTPQLVRPQQTTFEKIGEGPDALEVGETGIESIEQDTYKKKVVVKELAPDVAAINIWLKNRRCKVDAGAQRWADKVETGFTDNEGKDREITGMVIT